MLVRSIGCIMLAPNALAADKGFSGVEIRIGGGDRQGRAYDPDADPGPDDDPVGGAGHPRSVTSFTRLIIVSHFLRQALGTQTMPPNQVLIGLSLFSTYFIMQPVGDRINQEALQPMMNGKITEMQALDQASVPLRQFMLRYTREKDLALFLNIAKQPKPRNRAGSADADRDPELHDFRAENGLSDRIRALYSVSGHRHGGGIRPAVHGNDAACRRS